jgi:group I intron endonuclease
MWKNLENLHEIINDKFVIYCIRNLNNSKCYIGKTTGFIQSRLKGHIYDALVKKSKYKFHRALKKHGVSIFEVCIIDRAKTCLELRELEISYIKKYNSYKNGYNSTIGGDGLSGFSHTDKTKKLIHDIKKGIPMPQSQRNFYKKPIEQFDLKTGNIIEIFESYTMALHKTKINNITCACQGKLSHAGGFLWRYSS